MLVWDWSIFLGSILALMMLSYIWRPNVAFEISESVYIGSSVANAIVVGVYFIYQKGILSVLGGNILYIIPLILGLLLYSRYINEYKWLSKISLSILIGLGVGLGTRGQLHSMVINAILYVISLDLMKIGNIIYAISFITVTAFFIFGEKISSHPIMKNGIVRLGRAFLMISFGAKYGTVIWGRLSELMGVTQQYVLEYPGYYWIPIVVLAIVGEELRLYMKRKNN